MKHLLIVLLACAMLAGCYKAEDDANADGPKTGTSSEEPSTSETEQPAGENSGDDPESNAADGGNDESSDESASTASASGINTDELVGEWTGRIVFDPADREVYENAGMPEDQINAMAAVMESTVFRLVLNGDLSFVHVTPTPNGGTQSMKGSWTRTDEGSISLTAEGATGQPGGSAEMTVYMTVSDDRKTLVMVDPSGRTKSTPVYTRN